MTNLHNIKFYNPQPSSINCMNYESRYKKLALTRCNNSIEIWDLNECPHLERIIPGKYETSVESLVWCNERLFSTGLQGFIIEYDFETLAPKYEVPLTLGPAWCMDIDKEKKRLAVGTENGYINIFNIYDDGIKFEKILDKQQGRIMCIKWYNYDHLVTGSIDCIRVWNINTGQAIDKMTTGRISLKKDTIVWCLVVTDDFTIISGDSRGKLSFWNGKMGTLIETYQTHDADILCICLSEDQKTIYCSGVDPVISCFSKINIGQNHDKIKWVKSTQQKLFDHDVRSLCLKENTLISAGINSFLSFTNYNPKSIIKYPPFVHGSPASISSECRQILLRYHTHLELWQLGDVYNDENNSKTFFKLKKNPIKLINLNAPRNELILCSDLSENGKWLAYSTLKHTKLFSISQKNDEPVLTKSSFSLHPSIKLAFSNEKIALATLEGKIHIMEVPNKNLVTLNIDENGLLKAFVNNLIFSKDYLIVCYNLNNIIVWSTMDWTICTSLPKYECSLTAMALNPTGKTLFIAYSDHKLIEYNIEKKCLTRFSKYMQETSPLDCLSPKSIIKHIVYDPRNHNIVMLHDEVNIYIINKQKINENSTEEKRNKIDIDTFKLDVKLIKKYKYLAFMGWIKGDNELVIIEINPSNLFNQLPPVLRRKQFGV